MMDTKKNIKIEVGYKFDVEPDKLFAGLDMSPQGLEKLFDDASNDKLLQELIDIACDYVNDDIANADFFAEFPDAFFANIKVLARKAKIDLEQAHEWREDAQKYREEDFRIPFIVPCELDVHGFMRDLFGGERKLLQFIAENK